MFSKHNNRKTTELITTKKEDKRQTYVKVVFKATDIQTGKQSKLALYFSTFHDFTLVPN